MSFHIVLTFPDDWKPVIAQAQVDMRTSGQHQCLYEIIRTSNAIYVASQKLGVTRLPNLPSHGGHAKSHRAVK